MCPLRPCFIEDFSELWKSCRLRMKHTHQLDRLIGVEHLCHLLQKTAQGLFHRHVSLKCVRKSSEHSCIQTHHDGFEELLLVSKMMIEGEF